jgi:hypothetical protein
MKKILAATAVIASCYPVFANDGDDPAITVCESYINRVVINTPATYKRHRAKIFSHDVLIEYDAQNEYGALIRSKFMCYFSLHDGSFHITPETSDYDYFMAELVTIEAIDDNGLVPEITKLRQ